MAMTGKHKQYVASGQGGIRLSGIGQMIQAIMRKDNNRPSRMGDIGLEPLQLLGVKRLDIFTLIKGLIQANEMDSFQTKRVIPVAVFSDKIFDYISIALLVIAQCFKGRPVHLTDTAKVISKSLFTVSPSGYEITAVNDKGRTIHLPADSGWVRPPGKFFHLLDNAPSVVTGSLLRIVAEMRIRPDKESQFPAPPSFTDIRRDNQKMINH